MRLDNFTTAKCSKCGWIKQFQPGKEYDPIEFKCNCKEEIKGNKNGRNRTIKKDN